MSYFLFLFIFLGIPLLGVAILAWRDRTHRRFLPDELLGVPFWMVLLGHVGVAVLYTTPWDNYLVATGVWYYNPKLVTGITLGWVPIEEYIFFVLQTFLTGLWLGWLLRRIPGSGKPSQHAILSRWLSLAILGLIWLGSVFGLMIGWESGTYLCLILIWALPPVMLQFGFGFDILWRYRLPVGVTLVTAVAYLISADSLAISSGTWTIDPGQSLNFFIFGVLPIEEFIFFLVTNALIVIGMTLVLANTSHDRFNNWKNRIRSSGRYSPKPEQ
jgi:lycopene cyclase domain-containing protein